MTDSQLIGKSTDKLLSISLLFQNSAKKTVTLNDLIQPSSIEAKSINSSGFDSLEQVPIKQLIKVIFKTWDEKLLGEAPESIYQIRLIHLGKTLENDLNFESFDEKWKIRKSKEEIQEEITHNTTNTDDNTILDKDELYDDENDNEGPVLGDLRWDLSDIIHVSLRPIEAVKKIKKKNARRNLLSNAVGNPASRITSIRQSKVVSGDDDDEEGSSRRNGGGCCVIV